MNGSQILKPLISLSDRDTHGVSTAAMFRVLDHTQKQIEEQTNGDTLRDRQNPAVNQVR